MEWLLALISGLSGSVLGAIITGWITRSQLKKQFNYQNEHKLELWKREEAIALMAIDKEIALNTYYLNKIKDFMDYQEETEMTIKDDQKALYVDKWNKHSDLIGYHNTPITDQLFPFYYNINRVILNGFVTKELIKECSNMEATGRQLIKDRLSELNQK